MKNYCKKCGNSLIDEASKIMREIVSQIEEAELRIDPDNNLYIYTMDASTGHIYTLLDFSYDDSFYGLDMNADAESIGIVIDVFEKYNIEFVSKQRGSSLFRRKE